MTDEDKRKQLQERLAKAGISEEVWNEMQRMRKADISALDSTMAHVRVRALSEILDKEQFAAIPKVRQMLSDDAPAVTHGGRPSVFEVRMFALTVLQELYRRSRTPLDFGPVTVAKAIPLTEVEPKADAALRNMSEVERSALLSRVDDELAKRVQPSEGDRASVRAYRVLQLLKQIDYHIQTIDPVSLLTPLQEEIFASQVKSERPLPHLRVGTESPARTLGWVYRKEPEGIWVTDFSDHPLARGAVEEIEWLRSRTPNLLRGDDSHADLEAIADFLRKRSFVVEVK